MEGESGVTKLWGGGPAGTAPWAIGFLSRAPAGRHGGRSSVSAGGCLECGSIATRSGRGSDGLASRGLDFRGAAIRADEPSVSAPLFEAHPFRTERALVSFRHETKC